MTVYLEAADAVEREVARSASLSAVAADLKRVGSLQLAANEAQARLDDLNAEGERVSKELDQARQSAAQDTARAKEQTAEALRRLDEVRAQTSAMSKAAAEEVESVISTARATAKQIVDTANADAATARREADADLAATRQETADTKMVLADLQNQVTKRQADLDAINAMISDIKSRN